MRYVGGGGRVCVGCVCGVCVCGVCVCVWGVCVGYVCGVCVCGGDACYGKLCHRGQVVFLQLLQYFGNLPYLSMLSVYQLSI